MILNHDHHQWLIAFLESIERKQQIIYTHSHRWRCMKTFFFEIYQIGRSFFLIFNFVLHCVCEIFNLNTIDFDRSLTTILYFVISKTLLLSFNIRVDRLSNAHKSTLFSTIYMKHIKHLLRCLESNRWKYFHE